jgi:hypothetical protein
LRRYLTANEMRLGYPIPTPKLVGVVGDPVIEQGRQTEEGEVARVADVPVS